MEYHFKTQYSTPWSLHGATSAWGCCCSFVWWSHEWLIQLAKEENATVKKIRAVERLDFRVDEPQRQQGKRKWMKSHHMGRRYRQSPDGNARSYGGHCVHTLLWAPGRTLTGLQLTRATASERYTCKSSEKSPLAYFENKLHILWTLTCGQWMQQEQASNYDKKNIF